MSFAVPQPVDLGPIALLPQSDGKLMSAKGHNLKWCHARVMSVLPLKADIRQREWHVRYVPLADMRREYQSRVRCKPAGVAKR